MHYVLDREVVDTAHAQLSRFPMIYLLINSILQNIVLLFFVLTVLVLLCCVCGGLNRLNSNKIKN